MARYPPSTPGLTYRQSQWWIEDLHSTNGTFLNQEAVLEPVVITDGDDCAAVR